MLLNANTTLNWDSVLFQQTTGTQRDTTAIGVLEPEPSIPKCKLDKLQLSLLCRNSLIDFRGATPRLQRSRLLQLNQSLLVSKQAKPVPGPTLEDRRITDSQLHTNTEGNNFLRTAQLCSLSLRQSSTPGIKTPLFYLVKVFP